MLPRKRPVQGVAVEEDNNNSESSLKKNRIGCLIAEADCSNNNSTCELAGDSSNNSNISSSSVVVEPSLSNMALGDSSQYIDEDLHSRQLAVYGRETMRRLFASNVLVSGMQGLGAEVDKNSTKNNGCSDTKMAAICSSSKGWSGKVLSSSVQLLFDATAVRGSHTWV